MYFIFGIVPYYILKVLFLTETAEKWISLVSSLFAKIILRAVGVDLKIQEDPSAKALISKEKAVCFVSNHTSMLDIPAILYATEKKTGFIAKYVLAFVPLLNIYAKALGCVFIDRKNMRRSVMAIARGTKRIKKGCSMLVFPEGTRSKTGEISHFKHGSLRLAADADSWVIPITVKGLRNALEDRKKLFGKYNAVCVIGHPVKMNSSDSRYLRFEKIDDIEKSIRETYAFLGDR